MRCGSTGRSLEDWPPLPPARRTKLGGDLDSRFTGGRGAGAALCRQGAGSATPKAPHEPPGGRQIWQLRPHPPVAMAKHVALVATSFSRHSRVCHAPGFEPSRPAKVAVTLPAGRYGQKQARSGPGPTPQPSGAQQAAVCSAARRPARQRPSARVAPCKNSAGTTPRPWARHGRCTLEKFTSHRATAHAATRAEAGALARRNASNGRPG